MSDETLPPDARLLDAITTIERSRRRIAVIVDNARHVLGTITDGDVRRALLRGADMEARVSAAMNSAPLTIPHGATDSAIMEALRARNVLSAPLLDVQDRFDRVVHIIDLGDHGDMSAEGMPVRRAVIMAGGEGRRLRPLTNSLPKPMVEVGDMPVLERQVHRLRAAGISDIRLSVNYLGEQIKRHFGDGSSLDVQITYLHDDIPLGTAGPLSLVSADADTIVMNGDLVTDCDFRALAQFHVDEQAAVTVAGVEHEVKIPFGVLKTAAGRVTGIEEKPTQRFLCNAGIYILSARALAFVPQKKMFNMNDLLDVCLAANLPISAFPLHEFWSDIGTLDDLARVRTLFGKKEKH